MHSADVSLWRQYLGREQSWLARFTFARQVKKYHKCFKRIIPILDGQVAVVTKSENLEEDMIGKYLFEIIYVIVFLNLKSYAVYLCLIMLSIIAKTYFGYMSYYKSLDVCLYVYIYIVLHSSVLFLNIFLLDTVHS